MVTVGKVKVVNVGEAEVVNICKVPDLESTMLKRGESRATCHPLPLLSCPIKSQGNVE